MSGAAASGAAVAAAIAAAAKKRREMEEESMAQYNADDLKDWEFKIVRANTRRFKTAEAIRQLCEEESQAGWELIEKFDDSRIRFKRHTEARNRDQHLKIDPYRTQVGMGEGKIVAVVLGIIAVLAGLIAIFIVTSAQ